MSMVVATRPLKPHISPSPIRVMVVDDAVVVRNLLRQWIEAAPGLTVVAALRSGREAIAQIERSDPDVVILDVDMADIDGITALPRLLEKKRDLVVIMASTLTRRNAEISLRALTLGAADYIPKPESSNEVGGSNAFRRELIDKIRVLGARRRRDVVTGRAIPVVRPAGTKPASERGDAQRWPLGAADPLPKSPESAIRLRPFSTKQAHALLIGSSTGGPQALNVVMGAISRIVDLAPVLVTQHMPPTFTTILAEHLARASGRPALEAEDGEVVRAGRIYVAPGGCHMRAVRQNGRILIALDDGPPVNFCRPAVDPMFSSAAETWGDGALAVVLTGMGTDGTRGAADIAAAGGSVIAQDEATSVVWGMPGSVAGAELCSAVLPLDQIAPKLTKLFCGART
jgi:two-component system chemotaxis response regulator CheB